MGSPCRGAELNIAVEPCTPNAQQCGITFDSYLEAGGEIVEEVLPSPFQRQQSTRCEAIAVF